MGMHLLKHAGIAEAIEAFITSIALTPDPLLFENRGYVCVFQSKREYHKALVDYTGAIQFDDPSIPEIYYFRGTLNGLLENHGDAIQDLTKAIDLKGEDWLC
jgi:tetratricopeptide (TPR) repeat protein